MKRIILGLLIIGFSWNLSAQNNDKQVYLFSYFKDNGKDGLHLAYSYDGLSWTTLNNDQSVLKPEVAKDKLMRDPCIIRGGDGNFHMVWTVSWTDKVIGYASSKDLIHWSEQVAIPVMANEEGARNCWAPEITYDPAKKSYMIYWATTITGQFQETTSEKENGYNHRIYYTLTKDFKKFSKTKLLYNPGFNVIDATIIKDGKRFVMFAKDETREPIQKNIKIAFSKKINGPYSPASAAITGNYWAEGPTILKKDNQWTVYFDKYTLHQYGAISSSDLVTWNDISNQITLPKGIRHGSILIISEEELKRLN
jgi:beta-xylosidase